jgi:hypothetical protein
VFKIRKDLNNHKLFKTLCIAYLNPQNFHELYAILLFGSIKNLIKYLPLEFYIQLHVHYIGKIGKLGELVKFLDVEKYDLAWKEISHAHQMEFLQDQFSS